MVVKQSTVIYYYKCIISYHIDQLQYSTLYLNYDLFTHSVSLTCLYLRSRAPRPFGNRRDRLEAVVEDDDAMDAREEHDDMDRRDVQEST